MGQHFANFYRVLRSPSASGFVLRLLLVWSPVIGVFALPAVRVLLGDPLIAACAGTVSALYSILGVGHALEGAVLRFEGGALSFVVDLTCTGYFIYWFYLGAVLVFPASIRAKLVAALVGAALVFVLNVIRIVSLYYVMTKVPAWFDEIHLMVWQSLIVVVVGSVWYGWASTRPA